MRLPCCTADLSLLNNFQEKERFIFYCKIMKLALFVLLVAGTIGEFDAQKMRTTYNFTFFS